MFFEDEREHNGVSEAGECGLVPQFLWPGRLVARFAFGPMDKTRTVLRGAHPSYTDPADIGAETAQNCALTGAGM